MTHLYVSGRDHDLAITQRLHVLAVDAQTKWPWAAPRATREVFAARAQSRHPIRARVPARSSTQALWPDRPKGSMKTSAAIPTHEPGTQVV